MRGSEMAEKKLRRRERRVLRDMERLARDWELTASQEGMDGFGREALRYRSKAASLWLLRLKVESLFKDW